MGTQKADSIVEYSHMIGKNTAELTASDMAKYMKWWMSQPIKEDLVDMGKKKTKKIAVVKKKPVTKTKIVPSKEVSKEKGKVNVVKTKDTKKDIHIEGEKVVRVQAPLETPKKEKKRNWKWDNEDVQETGILDDILPDDEDTDLQKIHKQHIDKHEYIKNQEFVDEDGIDDELETDELVEEDIDEEIVSELDEINEEVIEESTEEPIDVPAGEEEIVVTMGLTALDVEALGSVLGYVLVESCNGNISIPEDHVVCIQSILQGLRQQYS